MERKHEADLFLIGDGADELLTACSRQTKNLINAMVHGDLEIGLRHSSLLTVSSHNLFSSRCVQHAIKKLKRSKSKTHAASHLFQFYSEVQRILTIEA